MGTSGQILIQKEDKAWHSIVISSGGCDIQAILLAIENTNNLRFVRNILYNILDLQKYRIRNERMGF